MAWSGRWVVVISLVLVVAVVAVWRVTSAQLEGLEGMAPPDDVTGVACSTCHGNFAEQFKFTHSPALNAECTTCHLEKGEGKHGGLTLEGRELCLQCHTDRADHYPAASCRSAGCHVDVHGSDKDKLFIPSRTEEYPGFTEATAGAASVGSDKCLACHGDKHDWWKASMHAQNDGDNRVVPEMRGCESCHGPGGNHFGRAAGIGDFNQAGAEEAGQVCLKCHAREYFASDFMRSTHAQAGVTCVSCHNPHDTQNKHELCLPPNQLCLDCHTTIRAEFARLSHHPVDFEDPRTGMLCVECHDPHAGNGRAMLSAPPDEFCVQCHVDKQGPFIYPHVAYESGPGRGCLTCHDYHGSNAPNLLKLSDRGLCLQCHTDRVEHQAGRDCWTSGCHTEHHGSNQNYFFFK